MMEGSRVRVNARDTPPAMSVKGSVDIAASSTCVSPKNLQEGNINDSPRMNELAIREGNIPGVRWVLCSYVQGIVMVGLKSTCSNVECVRIRCFDVDLDGLASDLGPRELQLITWL